MKIAYKWEMIVLLWFAFFLNQGDRQVFNSVLPLIKEELNLSDIQLGLIATVFTMIYGLLVPFAGYAGDIFRRKWVVLLSLTIFSAGTLFTGFAGSFALLLIFRSIATGAGEAFYYPASNALIGHYHTDSRAQAMAIHQTANYTGVVLGGFLAAYIGEQFGWRMSFFAYGGGGLVLAVLLFLRLKEPTQKKSQIALTEQIPVGEVLHVIFRTPTIIFLSLAFGCMIFVHIGYLTWMPTFLHEKFDLSLSNAGFSSMFYHHALAYVGVLLAGRFSDKWAQKDRSFRMKTEIVGLLLGAPFILMMGISDTLILTYVALAFFGLFRGVYDSNIFAVLFDVVESKYRSTATGLMLSFAFIIGALSPVILGWLKSSVGLSFGLAGLSTFYLLGGLLLWIALKFHLKKDFKEMKS